VTLTRSQRLLHPRSIFLYLAVGVISNGIAFGIFFLVRAIPPVALAATSLAYLIGVTVSYLGNSKFTFQQKKFSGGAMARYIASHVLGLALANAVFFVGVGVFHFFPWFAQIVAAVVTSGFLFVMQSLWVFKRDPV
jgi:putative flippase GtrA